MILIIDNFDSFTYNLYQYFLIGGKNCIVKRNNEVDIAWIEKQNFEAIVLSPGPGKPVEAGITMQVIQAFHHKMPILGICLGHQALGEFFGAKLIKASNIFHGKTSEIFHENDLLFENIPQQTPFMRYHSLILSEVKSPLMVTAYTKENEIMALRHESLKIFGVQFHPESILSPFGMQIIKNFIACI